MKGHPPLGPGAYDNDSDDEFLAKHDAHIRAEARKAVPSGLYSEEVLDLEADEVAQKIRIKLWMSRQKRSITHPKAYIRAIARTTCVDTVRSHKPAISLPCEARGETFPDDHVVALHERLQDPAYEVELRDIDPELLSRFVEAILTLPPRQKQAMFYALQDQPDDVLPLINALKARDIDVEAIDLPREAREVYLLRASLSAARKKLQGVLMEPASV